MASCQPLPWKHTPNGIRLTVRLTPRAGCNSLGGLRADPGGASQMLARVTAPPVDGAANTALIKLVADSLGVAKSAVSLTAGQTAWVKTLEIAGDPAVLTDRLSALTS